MFTNSVSRSLTIKALQVSISKSQQDAMASQPSRHASLFSLKELDEHESFMATIMMDSQL